jgi:hypothetical protein
VLFGAPPSRQRQGHGKASAPAFGSTSAALRPRSLVACLCAHILLGPRKFQNGILAGRFVKAMLNAAALPDTGVDDLPSTSEPFM